MTKGTVVIIFPKIAVDASADEKDILEQADAVRASLTRLGWDTVDLPVTLDLAAASAELARLSPRLVFNLVESLGGKGRLIAVLPSLLDTLGIPFTGAGTDAVFLTSNKLLAKLMLQREGIRTPAWCTAARLRKGVEPQFAPPYIVKQVWEHASIGMDDGAVAWSMDALHARMEAMEDAYIEPYIDGREFNIGLLGGGGDRMEPQVLPPAEIQFIDFPQEKPRVVGYNAKWVEGSFEFVNTPRRFDFPDADGPLLQELGRLSRACWKVFGLRGYARVDFRVDREGTPFVLEINTNPCISPDAGFMAAAVKAGLGMDEVTLRICADTLGEERQ
jgi:D-alanine-D-alanine ligase